MHFFSVTTLQPIYGDIPSGHFMVSSEIAKYRGMGGVRIEEVFVVTEGGCEVIRYAPPQSYYILPVNLSY